MLSIYAHTILALFLLPKAEFPMGFKAKVGNSVRSAVFPRCGTQIVSGPNWNESSPFIQFCIPRGQNFAAHLFRVHPCFNKIGAQTSYFPDLTCIYGQVSLFSDFVYKQVHFSFFRTYSILPNRSRMHRGGRGRSRQSSKNLKL